MAANELENTNDRLMSEVKDLKQENEHLKETLEQALNPSKDRKEELEATDAEIPEDHYVSMHVKLQDELRKNRQMFIEIQTLRRVNAQKDQVPFISFNCINESTLIQFLDFGRNRNFRIASKS
jgi:hypothetical protein